MSCESQADKAVGAFLTSHIAFSDFHDSFQRITFDNPLLARSPSVMC
jgi:hypothetical protein